VTVLQYHELDVFTDRVGGGNPVAVFVDAPALPDDRMQAVAAALGLSESVFVRPPTDPAAVRQLRIFTPAMELPFAGHPTIGTAQLLVELDVVVAQAPGVWRFALEERVGLVPIEVTARDGARFTWLTTSKLPERGPVPPPVAALAAMLGLEPADVLANDVDAPRAYSAGVPFLYIPVRDDAALARARVDVARWEAGAAGFWAPHLYLFVPPRASGSRPREVAARMFAPAMGIVEDPATGAGVAGLAGYLWERDRAFGRWVVRQGREMGRPSELHIELSGTGESLESVRVGGSAMRVRTGRVELPPGAAPRVAPQE
jgi:trans-2,3-dihydro-3-hydroxyanthranilate isomerase